MNKNTTFRLFWLSFIFCLAIDPTNFIIGQNNQLPSNLVIGNWQNAILRADGLTEIDGVEAFCQLTVCNQQEFIIIKFINKNNYAVNVEWKDAVFHNGNWYYASNPNNKTLNIPANSTAEGSCQGALNLKLSKNSIQDVPQTFEYFTVSGLKIIQ
ncbi:MAG: hypothetical protein IPM51_07940 [Sphingobacteriaceae bacterium]|nr:hypothetical protein [Sphingobacteriaceae bacterium]